MSEPTTVNILNWSRLFIHSYFTKLGYAVAQLVAALRYKQEGDGVDSL
jgi:hypothetical protein